jgi:fibronectin-binding autotransporter adhesin
MNTVYLPVPDLSKPCKLTRRLKLGLAAAMVCPSLYSARPACGTVVTSTWISTENGAWASTTKWSTGSDYPENNRPSGTDYVAIIAEPATKQYVITYSSSLSVNSLTMDSAQALLDQTSGTFTPTTVSIEAGEFELNNGTLENSSISCDSGSGGSFVATGGILNDMSFTGSGITFDPGAITVENGVSFSSAYVLMQGTFTAANLTGYSGDSDTTFDLDESATINNTGSNLPLATIGGNWQMDQNAVINGGTITQSAVQTLTVYSGTLNGATISGGSLSVGSVSSGGNLTVQNGLILSNPNLFLNGEIDFDGSNQTLDNVNVTNGGFIFISNASDPSTPVTLTLGPNASFNGGYYFQTNNDSNLVNDGTIVTSYPNGITIEVNDFTNNGSISANDGFITIDTNEWTNNGTISEQNGSTIALGGTFTPADVGNLSADSASFIEIIGTLNNSGNTFNVGNYGNASWSLVEGGTINGGVVNQGANVFTIDNGTLNGVTFTGTGNLQVPESGGLFLQNSNIFTSPSQIILDGPATLVFDGASQSIDNVTINCATGSQGIIYVGGPATPIGPDTVTFGNNTILSGDFIVDEGFNDSDQATLINNGTINADKAGFPTDVSSINVTNFTNNGLLEVSNGATLDLYSANWTNNGIISVTGGSTLALPGKFSTPGLGAFSADSSSFIQIAGTLNNTGNTLDIASLGGSWSLQNGQIIGGTVNLGSAPLQINGGTLNGVTFAPMGQLDLTGPLTFDGPSQTLDHVNLTGGGTVYVSGPSSGGATTLTIGPHASIDGGVQFFDNYYGLNGSTLVNDGTMVADTPPSDPNYGLGINTSNFINNGILEATNDSAISINSSSWSNNGTISLTDFGILVLNSTFTLANLGSLSADSTSEIIIGGILNNSGNTLNVTAYGGAWFLEGLINGGAVNQGTQHIDVTGAILNNVQFTGTGELSVGPTGPLTLRNGVSFTSPTNIDVLDTSIYFDGENQSIDNVNINSVGDGSSNIFLGGPTTTAPITVTLGQNAVVHGNFDFLEYLTVPGQTSLINEGTINADNAAGQGVSVKITNLTNTGLLEATNGATLALQVANFLNTGTIAVHGGSTITSTNALNVGEGTLTGDGIIDGDVVLDSDPSTLAFNIGGTLQDADYDSLIIDGNITLGGNLQLTLADGFVPSSSDVFTLLQVEDGGTLSGDFANVGDGQFLLTSDGAGEFLVNYGTGANADQIILSDFQVVPEPASLSLLATSGILLARGRWGRASFAPQRIGIEYL